MKPGGGGGAPIGIPLNGCGGIIEYCIGIIGGNPGKSITETQKGQCNSTAMDEWFIAAESKGMIHALQMKETYALLGG